MSPFAFENHNDQDQPFLLSDHIICCPLAVTSVFTSSTPLTAADSELSCEDSTCPRHSMYSRSSHELHPALCPDLRSAATMCVGLFSAVCDRMVVTVSTKHLSAVSGHYLKAMPVIRTHGGDKRHRRAERRRQFVPFPLTHPILVFFHTGKYWTAAIPSL